MKITRAIGLLVVLAMCAATMFSTALQANDRPSLEQRRAEAMMRDARYAALRRDAHSANFVRAMAAIEKLQEHGEETRHIVQGAVKEWLNRDQRAIKAHLTALGRATNLRQHEEAFVELQTKARDNIAVLEKGEPVQLARKYYTELEQAYIPLTAHYGALDGLLAAMERQPKLLAIYDPTNDRQPTAAGSDPASIREQVETAIGMTIEDAMSMRDGGQPRIGSDPSQRLLWLYMQSRRIEAYNESVADMFKPAELENARLVNRYREHIGLLPLEFDARLTQAARAHSKEMAEMGYFSHESPVEENRTFGMRCEKAGYRGASGENIAAGTSSGTRAFWMWFDSPGHHKNMAGGHNAIGVGLHQSHMTQNFGAGERLMNAK